MSRHHAAEGCENSPPLWVVQCPTARITPDGYQSARDSYDGECRMVIRAHSEADAVMLATNTLRSLRKRPIGRVTVELA